MINIKSNNLISILGLFLLTLIIAIFNSPYTNEPNCDVEVYRSIGMGIINGKILYKELFDHKPPMIHFLAAAMYPFGIWGSWFFAVITATLTSWYIYKISILYKLKYVYILPLIYLLLIFWQRELFGHYADTRFYSQSLAIILLYYCFSFSEKKFFIKGVLSALIFFTQQNDALIAFVLMLVFHIHFLKSSLKLILKIFYKFIFGVLLIAIPIFLYFFLNNALLDFNYAVFTFNKTYFWRPLGFNRHMLEWEVFIKFTFIPNFFIILIITNLFINFYFRKSYSFKYLKISLVLVIVGIFNILITGHYSLYYTFNLILPCILLILNILIFFNNFPIYNKRYTLFAIILILPLIMRRSVFEFALTKFKLQKFNTTAHNSFYKDIFDTISAVPKNKQTVFNFDALSAHSVTNSLKICPQNKWINAYFWHTDFLESSKFDEDGSIFYNTLLLPVMENRPVFILTNSDLDNEVSVNRPEINKLWLNFLLKNYRFIMYAKNDKNVMLFKLTKELN